MKKKKTKLKVLATAAAMVMVMGATAVTTWAFTKTDVTSKFEATFIGARDVEATINGASYLASGESATMVEQISEIKFDTTASSTENVTADFKQAITVVNESDYIYYEFSIKNDSTKTSYSDLIVNPVSTITAGDTAVASGFYFSADNVTYTALGADYITIAKGDTVYLRLKAQLVNTSTDTTLTGSMKLNLYTEKSVPAEYKADYEYSIVDGVAKRATVYTDGTVGSSVAMQPYEYVIATPSTAQGILDKNVNGKTIIFSEGTYGDLLFRPTRENVESVYEYDNDSHQIVGDKITNLSELSTEKWYRYDRSLNDIALIGMNGAIFTGVVGVESAQIGADTHTRLDVNGFTPKEVGDTKRYDYIRNVYIEKVCDEAQNQCGYVSNVSLDKLLIKNMNFEGKNGRIYIYGNGYGVTANFKNITIDNCEFSTEEAYMIKVGTADINLASVYIAMNPVAVQGTKFIENIVIKNNKSEGHFQSYYVFNTKNVAIINNESLNTVHNAIGIQSGYGVETSGYNIISNNIIDKTGVGVATGERAIRLNNCKNANIVIENNTFKNCSEDRTGKNPSQGKQLLTTGTLTNCTYVFANNTYDGASIEDVKGNGNNLTVYTEKPVIA